MLYQLKLQNNTKQNKIPSLAINTIVSLFVMNFKGISSLLQP